MRDGIFALLRWLQYFVASEEFDRTLPGSMNEHGVWNVDGPFRHRSTLFSGDKYQELIAPMNRELDGGMVTATKNFAIKLSHDDAKIMLATLEAGAS